MSTQPIYQASPIKRKRRTKAEMEQFRQDIYDILQDMNPMTIRQVFYQMVSRGKIDKTEKMYDSVQSNLVTMRKDGRVPFSWITDNTRYMRKPQTFDDLTEYMLDSVEMYRRDMWREVEDYVEIWCEKQAMIGLLYEITAPYQVPLMIATGFSSITFTHEAANTINQIGKPTYIYYFGDWDPSGVYVDKRIEAELRDNAPDVPITFNRVTVTPYQIKAFNLPTRPTKKTDSRSKNFKGDSVEVDAVPPRLLQSWCLDCIESHLPSDVLERTKEIEAAERETILNIARTLLQNDC